MARGNDPQMGPRPSVGYASQAAFDTMLPLTAKFSGEIVVTTSHQIAGAITQPGKVREVWMTVGASGKDDTYSLQVSGEVKINGTTCLSTYPQICHISGEASQQKTTIVTGDTGVTQAVINQAANDVVPGDIITVDLTLARTATPTTEISDAAVVVEFTPAAKVL